MGQKSLILNGNGGVDQIFRDLIVGHFLTVLRTVKGKMFLVLSRLLVHIIDGAGQVHIKIGVQMGLGQDDRFDIDHGEADEDDPRDQHDQQEGPHDLTHNPQDMQRGVVGLFAPALPRPGTLIGS